MPIESFSSHMAGDAKPVQLRAQTAKPVALRATRPNGGVEAWYQKQLEAVIAEMANSVQYWITATWRADTPINTLAQDASPIRNLRRVMERLGRQWTKRFDALSESLSERFADKSVKHTNAAMMASLKEAGFAVDFKLTPQIREAIAGTIAENVALIKSIPQQYLGQVESQVWRTIAEGSDLAKLTDDLQDRYGITYRRAKNIAIDQNAKAHAAIENARRQQLGIKQAQWVHSGAGKEPRPSHVKAGADKLIFDLDKGAYLDGEWVLPGQAINCRCVSRSIVPGWED